MKLSKKTVREIMDRFEAALDFIPALDKATFTVKREAAVKAARVAAEFLAEDAH